MYPSSIFSVTNLRERSISCSRDVRLADYVQLIPLFIAKYFQILIFTSKFSKFRFQLFTNYNKIARSENYFEEAKIFNFNDSPATKIAVSMKNFEFETKRRGKKRRRHLDRWMFTGRVSRSMENERRKIVCRICSACSRSTEFSLP